MNTLKTMMISALLATTTSFAVNAYAQSTMEPVKPSTQMETKVAAVPTAAMTEGEVRKVDKDNQKITLKHAEIQSLGMPGMTMVFRVKDASMLDKVKVGSKVLFAAESAGGAITVTALELAK